jgi:hypothetical protein
MLVNVYQPTGRHNPKDSNFKNMSYGNMPMLHEIIASVWKTNLFPSGRN